MARVGHRLSCGYEDGRKEMVTIEQLTGLSRDEQHVEAAPL